MNRSIIRYINETTQSNLIPWRSGSVDIKIGKTSVRKIGQDCIVLNNLKFVGNMLPSVMIVIPDISLIKEPSNGTNGHMIIARDAQHLENAVYDKGSCYAKTNFFGTAKEGRSFDFFQRLNEGSFVITDFRGLKTFDENTIISIVYKKTDYKKQRLFTGKKTPETSNGILIPVRIRNTTNENK